MCLILTLLAVPVFYSLFDDAQESHIFRGMSGRFDRFKSGVLRPFYERVTGKTSKPETEEDIEETNLGGSSESYVEPTGKN